MKIVLAAALALFAPLMSGSGIKSSGGQAIQAACGNDGVEFSAHKSDKIPPAVPAPDQAFVYVFSKLNYGGTPIGCQVVNRIGLDAKWVGANCGTSYLQTAVAPGEHHLCSNWQSKVIFGKRPAPALVGFSAVAGKSYYFRSVMLYQEGIVDLTLEPINEDEGLALLSSIPASESQPKQ